MAAIFEFISEGDVACVAGVKRGRGYGIGRKGKRGGGLPLPLPFFAPATQAKGDGGG